MTRTGELAARLEAQYTTWNTPPSDGLPDGAGLLLEAASALRAQSPAPGDEWRTMESAPKDGSEVILCALQGKRWRYGLGSMRQSGRVWDWPWAFDPTHWRPLPPPPANQREEARSDG